jgi:hypothetical protein
MMTKLGHSTKKPTRSSSYCVNLFLGLLCPGLSGCFDASQTENLDARQGELFAKSDVLWPMANNAATVPVCWTKPRLSSVYPLAALAPDVQARLVVLKKWVREIVEAEWNAKTPLEFTGWADCTGSGDAVELTPIDSATTADCGGQGQPCAVTLGKALLQKKGVFLNLFFGEEVLYSSRYQQSHPGSSYDKDDINPSPALDYRWWLPQTCFSELEHPWSTNNSQTKHRVNVEEPSVLAEFMGIYENCLKFNILHEFGHVAGFAHEQQRKDVVSGCRAELNPDVQYEADTPLGSFDVQSIMSYCRTDKSATLTTQDVEQTKIVYPASGGTSNGGGGGESGKGSAGESSGGSSAGAETGGSSGAPSRAGAANGGAANGGAANGGAANGGAPASAGTGVMMSGPLAGNAGSTGGAGASGGNAVSSTEPSPTTEGTGCAVVAAGDPARTKPSWGWVLAASAALGAVVRRRGQRERAALL